MRVYVHACHPNREILGSYFIGNIMMIKFVCDKLFEEYLYYHILYAPKYYFILNIELDGRKFVFKFYEYLILI